MEIKYTSDGKKVAVIGNLNQQTKIVQEIFIVNGQEIPSGENFTVTSLHDSPAVSWQENNIKITEKRYKDMEKQYGDMMLKLRKQKDVVEEKLSYLGKFMKNVDESSFENIVNFLTGNIKYVVFNSYNEISLKEYDLSIEGSDYGLRLLSIGGGDDGTLKFRLNRYSDYSGNNDEVYFFQDKSKAEEKVKDIILSKPISELVINAAKTYQVDLDKGLLNEYYNKIEKSIRASIDKAKFDIKKWEEQINMNNICIQ